MRSIQHKKKEIQPRDAKKIRSKFSKRKSFHSLTIHVPSVIAPSRSLCTARKSSNDAGLGPQKFQLSTADPTTDTQSLSRVGISA
jgi:hypothetical protein